MDQQKALRNESIRLVIDLSDYFKLRAITPLQFLEYITRKTLWLQSPVHPVDNKIGCVSAGDPTIQRDQHVILVKKMSEFTKQQIKEISDILVDHLSRKDVLVLLKVMKDRLYKSKNETAKLLYKELLMFEKAVRKDNDRIAKIETIKRWLGDDILGPFAITRILLNYYYDNLVNFIAGPMVIELRKVFVDDIYDYEVDQITIIDDRFFVFKHDDILSMNFPNDLNFEIATVADETRAIDVNPGAVAVQSYKSGHIEFDEQCQETYYEFMIERIGAEGNYFISLRYGELVFEGVDEGLIRILQQWRFVDWCRDTAKLELWFGRDERSKVNDYDTFRKEKEELQERIRQLEAENEELTRNDENEDDE